MNHNVDRNPIRTKHSRDLRSHSPINRQNLIDKHGASANTHRHERERVVRIQEYC